jgi:AcrR family transcriptional regulator
MADEGGLEAVSMRSLSRSLGVTPMSLYNHVAGKEAVLDGLVNVVLREFELPVEGDEWETAIRRLARSAHDALLRHPWACGLVIAPSGAGMALDARLAYIEAILGCLRSAGFSSELAYHGYHAVDSHILGFSMWEIGHQAAAGEDLQQALKQVSFAGLPHLAEHARQHLDRAADAKGDFDFSLDLVLEGLKARVET